MVQIILNSDNIGRVMELMSNASEENYYFMSTDGKKVMSVSDSVNWKRPHILERFAKLRFIKNKDSLGINVKYDYHSSVGRDAVPTESTIPYGSVIIIDSHDIIIHTNFNVLSQNGSILYVEKNAER